MRQLVLVLVIVSIVLVGCGKREWSGQANSTQPTVKNMTIDQASGESSENNLKSLNTALLMYCQDYDDFMPPLTDVASAQNLLDPYVKNPALWVDPRTQQTYGVNPALAVQRISNLAIPDRIVAFYETSPRPEGTRAVAFCDGHVALVRETQWPLIKQTSGIP